MVYQNYFISFHWKPMQAMEGSWGMIYLDFNTIRLSLHSICEYRYLVDGLNSQKDIQKVIMPQRVWIGILIIKMI